jgi:membrane-associated phospholipid phosphatase
MWGSKVQSKKFLFYRGPHRFWLLSLFLCAGIALGCPALHAQDPPQNASGDAAQSNPTPKPPAEDRDVSWVKLPQNILLDQKKIWLFPTRLAKGHDWLPTLAVAGITASLIVADPHDTPYFRRTTTFAGFNKVFSGNIASSEIAIAPAAILLVGYLRHDSYAENTALLAGEAFADAEILDLAMKAGTRRLRPSDIAPTGNFSDTFYESHTSATGFSSSFPSGHTIAAFSVATVIAHRYRQHRWVPWVAYGVATAIAFSRVTNQAHFPSDVFLGAALGFSISEFVVLRPH